MPPEMEDSMKSICALATVTALIGGNAFAGGPPCGVGCGTTVPPGLVCCQTWTAAGSPYCVMGSIQVTLLTIEPGVTVCMAPNAVIDVLSTMTAAGAEGAPILFTAANPADPWQGIRFEKTPPGSTLSWCVIELADTSGVRLNDAAPPAISDCVFVSNTRAGHGGAISAIGVPSDLTVRRCTFYGNEASQNGGALHVNLPQGIKTTIEDSVFISNRANPDQLLADRVGGAIWLEGGDLDILGSRFKGNRCDARCASEFSVCSVLARGGALFISAGVVNITNCSFISNRAHTNNDGSSCQLGVVSVSHGAAVYVNAGTVALHNCVLACNLATHTSGDCSPSSAGGGLYLAGGTVTTDNCTVARNTDASGLQQAAGSLTVTNSIIFNNSAGGTQVGGTATCTYSDIQNGFVGEGNINFSPVFAGTGCNPTDLMIVLGSLCIDAGNPAAEFDDLCLPPSMGGARNDMGAFGGPGACDWSCTFLLPTDVDRSGSVGIVDLLIVLPSWGSCSAVCPADVDCDGVVGIVDLLDVIGDWNATCDD